MINVKNKVAKFAFVAAGVAGLAIYSTNAMAYTQPVTANVAFDAALSTTKNSDIDFGVVTALSASTYTITTAAVVSTTAGTGSWLTGSPTAGDILITGSATATIDITANNYTANNAVTPSAATCAYNGGAEVACTTLTAQVAPGAAGKTLLVGVSITADGSQAAASTAAPTFDIVVNYT